MPDDNSAKKDAANQEKPYRPYTGPAAAELEQKIASALPRTRIYFAFNSDDANAYDDRMTQQFRQSAQTEILRHLDSYSRATIAEGTFVEKWPAMLADVSRYDTLVAFNAANAVLLDNFADASRLAEKPELFTVAKRAFLDMGLRDTMANLSISEAEYKKRRQLDPEYNIQTYENQFVNLLENHFYFARSSGTLSTEWPAKIEEASKFAPDLAVLGAARFFERAAIEVVDGRPQPVTLNASDFTIACKTAAKACTHAAETGDALLAMETMKKVLRRIVHAANSGKLEQKDFFALVPAMQAATEKFTLQSIDQLSDTISKQRAEGGNPVLAGTARAQLVQVLGQYFYLTEGKGTLATEWSATMDKVANLDAGVAASAANLYFAHPAKPISLPDFMAVSAKTTEICGKAAEQGYNVVAAETLANVLGHLRLNVQNEALPGAKRDEFTALGMSAGAVEEAIISKGIAEALADATMSDTDLARRRSIDPAFSDGLSEQRLLQLLDEYFYQTLRKGTISTEWPAKLQEITAADAEIAARAAQSFFTDPRGMINSLEDFKAVCNAATAASMAAHEKGFNLSAAETLSMIVKAIDKNIDVLSEYPDVLPALREMRTDAAQKLETVLHHWEEVVKQKPDDLRDAEQIEKANETYQAFVNTLAPVSAVPPPSAPAPTMPGPSGP